MQCPRCNKEWDVRMSPCPRCGLQVRLPGRLGSSSSHENVQRQEGSVAGILPRPEQPPVMKPSASGDQAGIAKVSPFPSLVHFERDSLVEKSRSSQPQPAIHPRRRFRTSPLNGLDSASPAAKEHLLPPDTLLHGGRYRLRKLQEVQEWTPGTFETTWSAQDIARVDSTLVIRELVVEDKSAKNLQSIAYNVTMAFTSSGGRLRIPMLRDTFIEHERCFFVFDVLDGYSLSAMMRRAGGILPEEDVTAFCVQICEMLQEFSGQVPPLLHGLIRPEHILHERFGSQHILINFSLLFAGAAQQFIPGAEQFRLAPYTAPEVSQGRVDVRSDLYALLAVAYHAVTGSIPASRGYVQRAQQLNPLISAPFDAILSRGLSANVHQRYQRPAELLNELLQLRPAQRSDAPVAQPPVVRRQQSEQQLQLARHVAQAMTGMEVSETFTFSELASDTESASSASLPLPEDLSPLSQSHDLRNALILFGILLLCMIPLLLSRGLL